MGRQSAKVAQGPLQKRLHRPGRNQSRSRSRKKSVRQVVHHRSEINSWPEYKPGTMEIIYSRLREGSLRVEVSTGKIFSVNGRVRELIPEFDDHAGHQRYAFVTVRKRCVSYRRDIQG